MANNLERSGTTLSKKEENQSDDEIDRNIHIGSGVRALFLFDPWQIMVRAKQASQVAQAVPTGDPKDPAP